MEGIVGRKVIIFYDDLGHISRKDGILSGLSDTEYVLNDRIIIPKSRVIRIEVMSE